MEARKKRKKLKHLEKTSFLFWNFAIVKHQETNDYYILVANLASSFGEFTYHLQKTSSSTKNVFPFFPFSQQR